MARSRGAARPSPDQDHLFSPSPSPNQPHPRLIQTVTTASSYSILSSDSTTPSSTTTSAPLTVPPQTPPDVTTAPGFTTTSYVGIQTTLALADTTMTTTFILSSISSSTASSTSVPGLVSKSSSQLGSAKNLRIWLVIAAAVAGTVVFCAVVALLWRADGNDEGNMTIKYPRRLWTMVDLAYIFSDEADLLVTRPTSEIGSVYSIPQRNVHSVGSMTALVGSRRASDLDHVKDSVEEEIDQFSPFPALTLGSDLSLLYRVNNAGAVNGTHGRPPTFWNERNLSSAPVRSTRVSYSVSELSGNHVVPATPPPAYLAENVQERIHHCLASSCLSLLVFRASKIISTNAIDLFNLVASFTKIAGKI
ncbi:uncharacterized protein FIBRA_05951 [Fibroporia radiculosa]|uniref:Transmembrane protein n=1 Tax=Fibroporia radiculosa TaxID=599839 RepID=J4GAE5_9APHY|nr:uncharacterized protein FIBRA_05951 [Fibroporia radiculosa]CCM03803.1 predicted protein [Fibroporia radiculosa]